MWSNELRVLLSSPRAKFLSWNKRGVVCCVNVLTFVLCIGRVKFSNQMLRVDEHRGMKTRAKWIGHTWFAVANQWDAYCMCVCVCVCDCLSVSQNGLPCPSCQWFNHGTKERSWDNRHVYSTFTLTYSLIDEWYFNNNDWPQQTKWGRHAPLINLAQFAVHSTPRQWCLW